MKTVWNHAYIDLKPSGTAITSMDEKLINHAVKYVEDNIARSDLSVEELSKELGMSRVHLYKKLLAITGKTPIEFYSYNSFKAGCPITPWKSTEYFRNSLSGGF